MYFWLFSVVLAGLAFALAQFRSTAKLLPMLGFILTAGIAFTLLFHAIYWYVFVWGIIAPFLLSLLGLTSRVPPGFRLLAGGGFFIFSLGAAFYGVGPLYVPGAIFQLVGLVYAEREGP